MAKKWIVNAPNGRRVHLNVGGGNDIMLTHLQVITNEKLAKQFPRIFVPEVSEPEVVVEEKQILTEPAPVPEVTHTEATPALSLEDTILTEPAPTETVAPEKKENKKTSKSKREYFKG